MTFDDVLQQVRELLQRKGRVAYRALKRRFAPMLGMTGSEGLRANGVCLLTICHTASESGRLTSKCGNRVNKGARREHSSRSPPVAMFPGDR
jgi:hypothetical protein